MADPAALEAGLGRALEGCLAGFRGLRDLRRLSGGASAETWAFEAECEEGPLPLVLRGRLGGTEAGGASLPIAVEAALVARAQQSGVPAPRVRCVLEASHGIGAGYVMQRMPGEALARRILREERFAAARPRMAAQCGEILARLHRVPCEDLVGLPSLGAAEQIAHNRRIYDELAQPHPVFELAFRFLEEHEPEAVEAALVHGDFRNGNLLVEESGVTGVLDWELAHRGDPMEDLGWLCVPPWRFGEIDRAVGGFGEREDLYRAYEAAGGRSVEPERLRFWEVFGALKWGIICVGMYGIWKSGLDDSVERAAIGRRASEAEVDLLRLLAP